MDAHTKRNAASGHHHGHQTLAVFRPGCAMSHLINRLTFVCVRVRVCVYCGHSH